MPKVKPPKTQNRVWIELERPTSKEDGDKQCELANNLLKRLHGPDTGLSFFWSEHKGMYAFGNVSFTYLSDRGTWLNLDHAGRPL